MKLKEIVEKFQGKKILVIGDIMLDKYVYCNVKRISQEAPVIIGKIKEEKYIPGGAGNSASNIASLKATSYLIGMIGKDADGKDLLKELEKRNINTEGIIYSQKKPTTLKQRIIAQGQQLIRLDHEETQEIEKKEEQQILSYVMRKIQEIDAIIISDYAKGTITKNLMKKITELSQQYDKEMVIDTKPENKKYYKNATIITPNEEEAKQMAKTENVEKAGKKLVKELNTTVLITRGEKGMTLFKKDGSIQNFQTQTKEVYDVSGAGDTAIATLTIALTTGATIEQAIKIANYAAGIVVGKRGTATLTLEELKTALKDEK